MSTFIKIKWFFLDVCTFPKDWYQARLATKIDLLNTKREHLEEDKISVDVDLRSVISIGPGSEKKPVYEEASQRLNKKLRRLELRLIRLKSRYRFLSGIDPDNLEEESEKIVRIDNPSS